MPEATADNNDRYTANKQNYEKCDQSSKSGLERVLSHSHVCRLEQNKQTVLTTTFYYKIINYRKIPYTVEPQIQLSRDQAKLGTQK